RHFGTDRVVTETGSLSPKSPLELFPPNRSQEAWAELCLIVKLALEVAADAGATLLLKPESTHVLASAEDALGLREELAHPNLGFVLDPAGLLVESRPSEVNADLERLVGQLGPCAPVIHAKDLRFDAPGPATPRAGCGVLDYGLFLRLL